MTPGIKSSELKLIVFCGLMMLANGTEYVNVPWEPFEWFIGLPGVYTVARGFVKREDIKATVVSTSSNPERREPS